MEVNCSWVREDMVLRGQEFVMPQSFFHRFTGNQTELITNLIFPGRDKVLTLSTKLALLILLYCNTATDVALVGGGNNPQPGEISLAHNGVLFLDELPEFKRTVLEVMRQPLEDRVVTISRAKFSVEYPASFMLVASMNPCPCGYFNHPEKECVCAPGVVQKYLNRISGPLLDRIDLHVEVTPVPFSELSNQQLAESSNNIRERVINARLIQTKRFNSDSGIYCNAQMRSSDIKTYCKLSEAGNTLLKTAMEKLGLSARAYDRILKVGRTIADLEASENIMPNHIAEAIQYRSLDRDGWAA